MHEAQMHRESSFVTLTYEGLVDPSLNYSDFQLFMKRLRKARGKVRFFACGEYGDLNWRPHWHAILFGASFVRGHQVSENTYASPELSKLWPLGLSSFGAVTYQSAAYVARYTSKKVVGEKAESYYSRVDVRTGECVRVVPEFARMSLKPGIGYDWFQKYWKEVYLVRDGVVRPGGFTIPPPRYYDALLGAMDGFMIDDKKFDRYVRAGNFLQDNTPERLEVRERCAKAKAAFLKRDL